MNREQRVLAEAIKAMTYIRDALKNGEYKTEGGKMQARYLIEAYRRDIIELVKEI